MDFSHLFSEFSASLLISLAFLALIAGFIDAVVGGGGLIQLPALLIGLPNSPIAPLLGTSKMAAFAGTSVAAYQYSKRIKFNLPLLITLIAMAYLASTLGASLVSLIRSDVLKPLILIILICIAIYVYKKKDLGQLHTKSLPLFQQIILGSLIALIVGFYDGFFGPGAGSFFILGFVLVLGFDFLTASAYAKVLNACTNISALVVFISSKNFILEIGFLMCVFNIIGNIIGTRMAFKNGNGFVRKIFLVVVTLMISRYAYDVFKQFYH